MTATPAPQDRRALALATLGAVGIAALVLVLFVLPAEYGIDPTGVGALVGLTKLDGAETSADPSGEAPAATAPALVLQTYESHFVTTSEQALALDGYLSDGETLLLPLPVAGPNVTRVTARLEFTDANTTPDGKRTRPDTFELELKAPHGDVSGGVLVRSDDETGAGVGEATYAARMPPYPRELDAASEAEAREAFAKNDPPDSAFVGEWTVRVSLVEAQDGEFQGAPLPGLPGTLAADDGNEWRLTVTVETYALEVAAKPGTQQRGDTVTLTLPAGGELEYKLAMSLGKRLDYAWSAGGATVYVDFHGEKTGDGSGAFTRHKNGELSSDAGTLIAPFDGRHGWFWRNGGGAPVTITLETRGQYDVIGRV